MDPALEFWIEFSCPCFSDCLFSEAVFCVSADGCDPYCRSFDDSHRYGDLHTLGKAVLYVINHDYVGHPHLVPCKTLWPWFTCSLWPGPEPWNVALRPFARTECEGTSFWSVYACLLYTSPSPRDGLLSRM